MKKTACMVLILGILFSITAFAQSEKTIKYIKSEENYDYSSDTVYIARDKSTNEIIPLAIGPLDGYSYAYLPNDSDFETKKETIEIKYTDLNEWQSLDMYIREMTGREIFSGYSDGTFQLDKILTRAEMATVYARMFKIEKTQSVSCFDDIPENHWAKDFIMAHVDNGVFEKDINFNPDALITREQLAAMTFRMLEYMGMIGKQEEEFDFSKYQDFDEVSEYAKTAYKALLGEGYQLMTEIVENNFEDTSDDEFYFYPKKTVTRLECCKFLYQFIRHFFNSNAPAIRNEDAPEIEIPILDGSTSTYSITQNIYSIFYNNYDKAPGFPKSHSKTVESYKRLIDGEVEMIFVPDAGEDILNYAEEKGVKLKFIPIANEALVFFTAAQNPVSDITTEQLHNIYVNNGITNWKEIGGTDGALAAYCRNEDSGSHAQMEKFILDGKEINENIAKERTSIIMSSILTDVDDYNKENEGNFAMGYSLYYYYQNNQTLLGPVDLKLMSIEGTEPTDETIANSTYPYTTNYYAVIRDGENNSKIDAFAELMQGEFGDVIVQMSGLGVIK